MLYERQPRLGTRTSTSVRDQAYSTPVPLAYLAARLAGITKETTVYEPTAGNGALLITADPAKTIVNELNPERRKNLREQGFSGGHGSRRFDRGRRESDRYRGVDVVIANPPFGAVKEERRVQGVRPVREIQPATRPTKSTTPSRCGA
jgi:predicted RNA methylase